MGNVVLKEKVDFTEEDTKKLFALKYISKEECIRKRALTNTFRERDILEELAHPFICNLRFAFQDDDYMYMVMDLMIGGDLRFHITRRRFIENVIRFWIAELACAIVYLHNRGIVHRDIKPDNILLDEKGHVALTDFNIATRPKTGTPLRSHSGTYSYMAPEILANKGYTYSVDWWSLGVLFYECIYGKRPFRSDDTKKIKHAIQHETIKFPTQSTVACSPECISAMQGFLDRDISTRLGCGPDGLQRIKDHPFFRHMDWDRLEKKGVSPPFVPDQDRSNFDITYDLEELLLEQNPLEARPRKRKGEIKGKFSKELQLIERKFRVFDYLQYEKYEGYVDPVRKCVGQPPAWVKPLNEPDAVEPARSQSTPRPLTTNEPLDGEDSMAATDTQHAHRRHHRRHHHHRSHRSAQSSVDKQSSDESGSRHHRHRHQDRAHHTAMDRRSRSDHGRTSRPDVSTPSDYSPSPAPYVEVVPKGNFMTHLGMLFRNKANTAGVRSATGVQSNPARGSPFFLSSPGRRAANAPHMSTPGRRAYRERGI
ncbi:Serine/threonine kinase [Dimargaris xerosporica]|nr:Serine/threonine kinase [Dimargaris xerosporica]